jgi:hypothetical protein
MTQWQEKITAIGLQILLFTLLFFVKGIKLTCFIMVPCAYAVPSYSYFTSFRDNLYGYYAICDHPDVASCNFIVCNESIAEAILIRNMGKISSYCCGELFIKQKTKLWLHVPYIYLSA